MDALGFDVEETKGGNTRGSGYWEAPDRKGDLELVWWEVFLSSQVAGLGVGAGGTFGGF